MSLISQTSETHGQPVGRTNETRRQPLGQTPTSLQQSGNAKRTASATQGLLGPVHQALKFKNAKGERAFTSGGGGGFDRAPWLDSPLPQKGLN